LDRRLADELRFGRCCLQDSRRACSRRAGL